MSKASHDHSVLQTNILFFTPFDLFMRLSEQEKRLIQHKPLSEGTSYQLRTRTFTKIIHADYLKTQHSAYEERRETSLRDQCSSQLSLGKNHCSPHSY